MLASEFVKAVQDAGFSWEKITFENMSKQPNGVVLAGPGIRIKLTDNLYTGITLDDIHQLSEEDMQAGIRVYKQRAAEAIDFDNLPEKGN
jgi:hypothetical protein